MLQIALIIALIVYFIKVTTWPGMIFEKAGIWSEKTFGEYLNKPLLGCPVCMTPWWGTIIYLIGHYTGIAEFSILTPQHLVFTLFTAAGMNAFGLMFNKEYDVAKKEDKILDDTLSD